MRRPLNAFGVSIMLIFVATNASGQGMSTSETCKVGSLAPAIGFWSWPADTRVKVYLDSNHFNAEDEYYILLALRNWDTAFAETASGVRFEFQGATLESKFCENCLTIRRGQVFDKRHAAELQALSERGTQIITYASIVIDSSFRNPRTLTSAVAHEIGHSLGLLDCYACNVKSTVMNRISALNRDGMDGPTACDKNQVKSAYRELKAQIRPRPVAPTALTVDEGEEPVADDTPPVVIPAPKPNP